MRLSPAWTKLWYVSRTPGYAALAVRARTKEVPSIDDIVRLIGAEKLGDGLDVKSFLAEFDITPETWDEWISRTITASLMLACEVNAEASPLTLVINSLTLIPPEIKAAIAMVTVVSMHLGALMERERWRAIEMDGATDAP